MLPYDSFLPLLLHLTNKLHEIRLLGGERERERETETETKRDRIHGKVGKMRKRKKKKEIWVLFGKTIDKEIDMPNLNLS